MPRLHQNVLVTMVFKLEPCDASLFEAAPTRFCDAMEIERPAPDVWRELIADGALGWCRALAGAQWTSPRPFGVGTTRTMRVAGALVIHENFFRWEEGRRKSFYVVEANLPLFKYFGEDYLVEEMGPDACRFTWTMAGRSTPFAAPGAPLLAGLVRSIFADTRKHFR
jgi:hypothetical protein